jgi:cysteine desulfurase/selenocysteine lyase
MPLDVESVRADFPVLDREVRGEPLVYLDNAATSQTPTPVVEAMTEFYEEYNSNVHRSIHQLGAEATEAYEDAHERVGEFVGGADLEEIVFTKNCTEAVNAFADAWGRKRLGPGDEVVLTEMEHHSNIVPWQQVADETGATIRWAPVTDSGHLDLEATKELLGPDTAIVAATQASNVLGTIPPAEALVEAAHDHDAKVLLDGAQSVPHFPVDVKDLDVDFLAFSGHKMLGPTGIGVLYGKRELLDEMDPFLFGGEMIKKVTYDAAKWNDLPWKFEAGTPPVAEGIGLGAAVDYLEDLGMDAVAEHEREIVSYAWDRLRKVDGLTVYGPPPEDRTGVVSFTLDGIHAHDLSSIISEEGVAVRAGHHCAQPLMDKLGTPATTRASFYVYNTRREVDALVEALAVAKEVFDA